MPAIFFTCVVMLIARMYAGPSSYSSLGNVYWLMDSGTTSDFFFYWKTVAVYVCAAVALVFLGVRAARRELRIQRTRLYFPLAAYLLLAALSAAFSSYPAIAWFGADGLYSGSLFILCCGVLVFYIINTVSEERHIKWIVYPLGVAILLASVLGITQAAGYDFFQTAAGQKLLTPNIVMDNGMLMWDFIDWMDEQGRLALEFLFTNGEVYQTLGNPNYVAMYTPLVLPLFAVLFLREEKWNGKKVLWAATFGLILFSLFGSQSTGGVVGAVVCLIAAAALGGGQFFRRWIPRKANAGRILPIVGILAVCVVTGGAWLGRDAAKNLVESVGVDSVPPVIAQAAAGAYQESDMQDWTRPPGSRHKIDYLISGKDGVQASVDGAAFILTQDGAPGAPAFVTVTTSAAGDGNPAVSMTLEGEQRVWSFEKTEDGYLFVNDIGKLTAIRPAAHIGNDTRLGLGTGRAYTWSRTVPLLRDTLLLGRGPDTFALYFPQDDYVGKYNGNWDLRAILDKPHNLYLGIGFGTGVLSLLCWLAMVIGYLVWSWRLYRKRAARAAEAAREESTEEKPPATDAGSFTADVGRGIAIGVVGFLAACVAYDGVSSVMPLFYGLLALGVVCNSFVARQAKASVRAQTDQ